MNKAIPIGGCIQKISSFLNSAPQVRVYHFGTSDILHIFNLIIICITISEAAELFITNTNGNI